MHCAMDIHIKQHLNLHLRFFLWCVQSICKVHQQCNETQVDNFCLYLRRCNVGALISHNGVRQTFCSGSLLFNRADIFREHLFLWLNLFMCALLRYWFESRLHTTIINAPNNDWKYPQRLLRFIEPHRNAHLKMFSHKKDHTVVKYF